MSELNRMKNEGFFNIDCIKYMEQVKDNSFDICITSPPYNMNLRIDSRGTGYCSRQVVNEFSTKYKNFNDNMPMDEYEAFLIKVLNQITRVSKLTFFNIQMITGNKPALFRVMGHFADKIKELVIWDKGRSQPAMLEGALNSQFELIIVLGDRPITRVFQSPKFSRGTLSNLWDISPRQSTNNAHKASFPVELVDFILSNFEAKSVFDPFMGTGTTAIAAHKAGCKFAGCEIDRDYYLAALERIELETAQLGLFSGV